MTPWIGVDLDGTLAHYDGWKGQEHIGQPIPLMVERVKGWLAEGKDVRIFTARVYRDGTIGVEVGADLAYSTIQRWTYSVFGRSLRVTNIKDFGMIELWDDRSIQVIHNTGKRVGENEPV